MQCLAVNSSLYCPRTTANRCPSAVFRSVPCQQAKRPSTSSKPLRQPSASESRTRAQWAPKLQSAVLEAASTPFDADDLGVSTSASSIIQYAMNLARVSESYEVHSWMILLGLLKEEKCTAAKVLQQLGLDDLYGAWHEVLWALHVCDGLQRRGFAAEITFNDRAYKVVRGSLNFAEWQGNDKVNSEDLLMALAAGNVLDGLFPDLDLTFAKVRKAVEKAIGQKYQLPDDKAEAEKSVDQEVFL